MEQAAVIVGASGGIGRAFADALTAEGKYTRVWRFSRSAGGDAALDLTVERSIEAAAAVVADGPPPTLIFVATGMLHEAGRGPEKTLRALDSDWLARSYAINAIGPALIAKHFAPILPRDERSILAFLSARVGSISDNRTGGWHGYRCAKAALNMLVKNVAIELARTHKRAVCVALHPGTVDTALSSPFQGNVMPGKLFSPDRAAVQLLDVLDGLRPSDSGKLFAWDGEEIAP
jgi:NAD(P)-dependent dehydrogenase (short-subunit alcohol dehydrogenase family)